ncbi:MAG: hypothetical protein PHU21_03725, partial [Elusimicrobia bacterium]|nr:hypothetical protein [Elusimicrobiota bacterium]
FLLLALASPAPAQQLPDLSSVQAQLSAAVKAAPIKSYTQPRHDLQCTFAGVLSIMGVAARPELPMPPLYLQDKTPLKQFQDAVEPQWQMRPEMFLNVYVAARNEIYVLNEAEYYQRVGRFVDDSIAHELVHYVQVMYKKIPIEQFDDGMEGEAISVQTEFRERYMKAGVSPCGR